MNWIFKQAGQLLDFEPDRELLDILQRLAAVLPGQGEADAENVPQLLEQLIKDPGAVKARLEEMLDEVKAEAVTELWMSLKEKCNGRIPDDYDALFFTLDRLVNGGEGIPPARLDWQLLDAGREQQGAAAAMGFRLAATLGTSLGYRALRRADYPATLGDLSQAPLCCLSLSGDMAGEAGAQAAWAGSSAQFGTSGSGHLELAYYFHNDIQSLFARTLARNLLRLASPFDLADLQRAMGDGLQAVSLEARGEASFSGRFKLAESLALGLAGPTPVSLELGFKAGYGGDYRYLLRPTPEGDILLELSRARRSSDSADMALRVDLDLGALVEAYAGMIQPYLGEAGALLDKLQAKLPKPGALRKELLKALKKSVPKEDMQKLLIALTGQSDDGESALDMLVERLQGEIDTHGGKWRSITEDTAAEVVERALGIDQLPAEQRDILAGEVGIGVKLTLDWLQKQLDGSVQKLLDSEGTDKLEDWLAKAGQGIDAGLADAEARAEAILPAVRAALERYQGLLGKLRGALEKAAKARLEANLWSQYRRESGQSMEFRGRFRPGHPQAAALFGQALSGRMDRVFRALSELGDDPDGPLIPLAGSMQHYIHREQKSGYDLLCLDFQISGHKLLELDVDYRVDLAGNVRVDAAMTLERVARRRREGRALRLVSGLSLAAARQTRQLSLGLELSHRDEELEPEDLQPFFGSLEVARLLAGGATQRALDMFADLQQRRAGGIREGRLEVGFNLDGADIQGLMGLAVPDGDSSANPYDGSRVMRIAAEELVPVMQRRRYGKWKLRQDAFRALQREYGEMGVPANPVEAVIGMGPELADRISAIMATSDQVGFDLVSPEAEALDALAFANRRAQQMVRLVGLMRELYFSRERPEDWPAEAYEEAQLEMDQLLAEWLRPDTKFVFLIADEVRDFTLAFLRILARLSGLPLNGERSMLRARMILGSGDTERVIELVQP